MSAKVFTIKGTLFWCHHAKPSKFGGYNVELCRLDDKTVAGLKKLGLKVNFDTDNDPDSPEYKGYYRKFTNDAPVTATDMKGKPLPVNLIIANLSEGYVAFRAKPWTWAETGKSGVKGVLLGIKVEKLVEYDPEAANREQAARALDAISGDGFVLGEDAEEGAESADLGGADTVETEDTEALFGDD